MTPEQHRLHIQDLERALYKAEHGMGMPYSAEDVAHYRRLLEQARKDDHRDRCIQYLIDGSQRP